MKNIMLKVTQKDLINDSESVIYQGDAHHTLNSSKLEVRYVDRESFDTVLVVSGSEALLERSNQELKTSLKFKVTELTTGSVSTSEGTISLEIRTLDLITEENIIVLYYDVLSQDNIVSRFMIEWEWTDEQH